jgi:hypothetical protein
MSSGKPSLERAGLALALHCSPQLRLEHDAIGKPGVSLVEINEQVAIAADARRKRQVVIAKDDLLMCDVEPAVPKQNGLHHEHDGQIEIAAELGAHGVRALKENGKMSTIHGISFADPGRAELRGRSGGFCKD